MASKARGPRAPRKRNPRGREYKDQPADIELAQEKAKGSYKKQFKRLGKPERRVVRNLMDPDTAVFPLPAPKQSNIDKPLSLLYGGRLVEEWEFESLAPNKDIHPNVDAVSSVFPTIALKWMAIMCDYVNQSRRNRYAPNKTPYCTVAPYGVFDSITKCTESSLPQVSKDFDEAGFARKDFFRIKYIFILCASSGVPRQDTDGWFLDARGKRCYKLNDTGEKIIKSATNGHSIAHSSLLVISPMHRTVDYLDSLDMRGFEKHHRGGQLFLNVFTILAYHLGSDFIPGEWRMRAQKSPVQRPLRADCVVLTCANAMCIAFGYPLDYPNRHGKSIWHKRQRMASELANGGLEAWQARDDYSDKASPFAYKFGNIDHGADFTKGGWHLTSNEIYNALPRHVRQRRGKYKHIKSKKQLIDTISARIQIPDSIFHEEKVGRQLIQWIQGPRHDLQSCIDMMESIDLDIREHVYDAAVARRNLTKTARSWKANWRKTWVEKMAQKPKDEQLLRMVQEEDSFLDSPQLSPVQDGVVILRQRSRAPMGNSPQNDVFQVEGFGGF